MSSSEVAHQRDAEDVILNLRHRRPRGCQRDPDPRSPIRGQCINLPLHSYPGLFRVTTSYVAPPTCEDHATYDERVLQVYAMMTGADIDRRFRRKSAAARVERDAALDVERARQEEARRVKVAENVFGPPLGDPACLAWEVTDEDRSTVTTAAALMRWQNHRCAICAEFSLGFHLDHNHATGNVRGFLCPTCNAREVHAKHGTYLAYRTMNPAMMLGLALPYSWARQRAKRDQPYPLAA